MDEQTKMMFLCCIIGIVLILILMHCINLQISIYNKRKENKKLIDKINLIKPKSEELDFDKDIKELLTIIDEVFDYYITYIITPKLVANKVIINDNFSNQAIFDMSDKILKLLNDNYKKMLNEKYFNDIEEYIIFKLKNKFNKFAVTSNLSTLIGKTNDKN